MHQFLDPWLDLTDLKGFKALGEVNCGASKLLAPSPRWGRKGLTPHSCASDSWFLCSPSLDPFPGTAPHTAGRKELALIRHLLACTKKESLLHQLAWVSPKKPSWID
uniref:Uncharacterized protein n=1 Tax=Myotis myotis TaxID=51298 RepID=A0A7J7SPL7_MYOMY|nr:hypothetical protein mMyoMyo1_001778 [Myotis myotis]